MTDDEVLARGDALSVTLEAARAKYNGAVAENRRASTDKGQAANTLRTIRASHAEGNATADDLQAAEMWLEECGHDQALHYEAMNRALETVKRMEYELRELMRANPGPFAERAEQATQAALRAREAAAEALGSAQEADAAAAGAWQPLCAALGLAPVRPWPFVSAASLANVDHEPPRPSKVQSL